MSPYVTWLFLVLLGVTTAQNATSDQTVHQVQNPTDETPHHGAIETATRATGHAHEHHQHSPTERRDERPHLKFNPQDLIPLPLEGHVAQFWLDHPDFKAIPDLPARDTAYPKWLLRTMGRIPATTPAPTPIEIDEVPLSQDSRTRQQPEDRPMDHRTLESESRNSIPETLPRRNDMERRFEINNLPPRRETVHEELILPPGVPIQELPPNHRMQHHRPIPNNIQRQAVGTVISEYPPDRRRPIYFRVPLNLGLGRIQHIKSMNTQRNPSNFVILRDNRFENRPFINAPAQMPPMQRQNFRGIPVTVSRPSMMHQPGILMLPMRNQNVPSRVRQSNFIQSHPQRMAPNREWFMLRQNQDRPQHPSSTRQHETPVDPRFSRESLSVQDENSRRLPTSTNRRQDFETQGKQANNLQNGSMQPNEPASFPRRSGIGARHKRQANFDSFDPFGMGNIFSFFPSEKEEPQNAFNWFPRESMMNRPTKQSPPNPGIYIPNVNKLPVKPPPKQQITYPQNGWVVVPPPSGNPSPNTHSQNPQPNRGSSNKQLPADFMIIRPRKQNGGSNKMPWMLSNLFGTDVFPENGGNNKLWSPFQNAFDDNPNTNNKKRPNSNRGEFPDNGPRRQFHGGRGPPPPNNQQFPDEESEPFEDYPEPTQHSNADNNNQQPPPGNRNDNNGHARPHDNWRQTHPRPVQTQPPTVPQTQPASQSPAIPKLPSVPHGKWIPRKSAHTKAPVTTHFHQMPLPHDHHHPNHHHPDKQPSTPTVVHPNHKDSHHKMPIQPEIKKGKRKLSPSEVRHLLSLLPKFPKEIHGKAKHGKQTVGLTLKANGNRHKRRTSDPNMESADIDYGNLTQNYPGSNQMQRSNSTKSPKTRSKRDIEESIAQDVVFGTYGYHSGYDYHDGSYSDYSSPSFGFSGSHSHGSGIGDLLGNLFSKKGHNLFSGNLDLPYHGYYNPHLGFGHFPHGHGAGHYHPHHHHSNYWPGFILPEYQIHLPGGGTVAAIPPAVPRANPDQISYTARFRYRFGIYPGYSDYIPGTNDHEIFFYYDAKQPDRAPDALIPFRSYY